MVKALRIQGLKDQLIIGGEKDEREERIDGVGEKRERQERKPIKKY